MFGYGQNTFMNDVPPLPGNAGSPHDSGMEIRLQRLDDTCSRIEVLLANVDDRLRKVEIDLAEMRGRISHLPLTRTMITTMLGGQVAFAAAILAILKLVGAH
jgi:hypothetical protein